jgi:hypothetical protein
MRRTEQDRRRRQINRRIREVLVVRRMLAGEPPPEPDEGVVEPGQPA